jgi:oligosaccharide repeat unit polymerase
MVYLLAVSVAAINSRSWGVDISLKTVGVVVGALLAFFIGSSLAYGLPLKGTVGRRGRRGALCPGADSPSVRVAVTIAICTFMTVTTAFQYLHVGRLALSVGAPTGFGQVLYMARVGLDDAGIHSANPQGFALTHALALSMAFAYLYVFLIVSQKVLRSKNARLHHYIPIVIYLIQCILTTGRTRLIYFLTTSTISYLVIHSIGFGQSRGSDRRHLAGLALVGALFLMAFSWLGYMRGGVQATGMSVYLGSSIYALDGFLGSELPPRVMFGEETIYSFYDLLRDFGVDLPAQRVNLEATLVGGQVTNIYTALRRYIRDYSLWGMGAIQFLLGFIYTRPLRKMLRSGQVGFGTMTYAMLFYPIVEAPFEERFFVNVLTFSTLYHLLYMRAIFWVLWDRPRAVSCVGYAYQKCSLKPNQRTLASCWTHISHPQARGGSEIQPRNFKRLGYHCPR